MDRIDPLSATFQALGDPTRRQILERLAHGPATVSVLAEPLAMSRPAVTQHLNVLEHAGLIVRTKQGRWRTCEMREEPLTQAQAWVVEHRSIWLERFARLEETLEALEVARTATTSETTEKE
ncbi:metalloregulator ArsR/SmtB family transcription factor [Gordonia sp. HY002]|uniref:ArsR/SmtB family transcription factor n=1 Tax=Gordonia zhenghanii TaxID=2911516 RepID=UPI001EF0E51D|nr:metalloregulator ArsR/SmtB family transcription factor [Gordonia zhenghanii]MCF8569545.1 metalloregulator ArsR/SmtB family transcription factor [Gordonia zhenghanii]MCF8603874.1 metalloregulator ArsR/SmtB family transcription factor [Gordonia zhenghanii]